MSKSWIKIVVQKPCPSTNYLQIFTKEDKFVSFLGLFQAKLWEKVLLPLIHLNFILPHRPFWWPILRIWACTRSIEAFEKLYKIQFHLNLSLEFSSKYEEITNETIRKENLPVSVPILTLLLRNTPACVSVSPKLSSSLLQSRIECGGSARAQAETRAHIVPCASAQYEGARARFFSATRLKRQVGASLCAR